MKLLFFASLLIFAHYCSSKQENRMKTSITYFKSWTGYTIPYKPIDAVSKEEALLLETYYIGYFDEGKIQSFEKYYKSELEWRDEYLYYESGKIKQRKMTKRGGDVNIQKFDKRGKVIQQ